MSDEDWLAERFEQNRAYLRQVSYRLLGSQADAEDVVQEAWLRLSRSDADQIRNLTAWLTTVVSRICLDRLRDRATHSELLLGVGVPELALTVEPSGAGNSSHTANRADLDARMTPVAGSLPADPADEAALADSVGLALVVVLDTLSPAERLAFVLHDMFGLPFEQIGQLLEQSPVAARQLASRARRRVRNAEPAATAPPEVQRSVVDAFFAAARDGDFEALLEQLHPDAVLRADGGAQRPNASAIIRGRDLVARRAMMFDRPSAALLPVLANGLPAVLVIEDETVVSVMVFTVVEPRIRRVDILLDPERLSRLNPSTLAPPATGSPHSPRPNNPTLVV